MTKKLLQLIPASFQKKGLVVVVAAFVRAMLNFIGLAAMLPVLLLILDANAILTNPISAYIYGLGIFPSVRWFVIGVCVAVILVFLIKNLLNIALLHFQNRFFIQLFEYFSKQMFVEYYHRGLGFIKQHNSVMLTHQVNQICSAFVFNVLGSVSAIISEGILMLILFVSLLIYNPLVSFMLILVFIPIVLIYILSVRNKLQVYGKEENEIRRQQSRMLHETFRGYVEIEINHAFLSILKRFDKNIQLLKEYRFKNERISAVPNALIEMGIVVGMILLILMNMTLTGISMQLLFGVFAVAALRMLPAVRMIMGRWMQIKYNQYALEVIEEGLLQNEKKERKRESRRLNLTKSISVCDLSFAFEDNKDRQILSHLSFTINKGECVGIKGASGAGKTTLFHLLMGFYTPDSGSIYVDDIPLTPENTSCWHNNIAYVSQHVFVMDASFAHNIAMTYDNEEPDRGKINNILELLRLKPIIDALPQGMDTRVGEAANRLSGGEKQRIGIARALYKDAQVLFFDEATSALDTETEQEINQAIKMLSEHNKELTFLIIAHRESTLSYCDRIINIETLQNESK